MPDEHLNNATNNNNNMENGGDIFNINIPKKQTGQMHRQRHNQSSLILSAVPNEEPFSLGSMNDLIALTQDSNFMKKTVNGEEHCIVLT